MKLKIILIESLIPPPGLLWNLSSAEYLKSDLMKEALPVLTEHVLLPYTKQTTKTERDPEVFLNATGCIRLERREKNYSFTAFVLV